MSHDSSLLTGSLGFLKTENLFDRLKQEARDEAAENFSKEEVLSAAPSGDDLEEQEDDSFEAEELKTASLSSNEEAVSSGEVVRNE